MAVHSYMETYKRKYKKSYLCQKGVQPYVLQGIQCQIAQDNLIYDYCDSNAQKAKLLYNAALFRIRQIFTGWDKDSRTDNEKEAFAEVTLLQQTYPSIKVKRVISYCHLEKLMRVTHNPQSLPLL